VISGRKHQEEDGQVKERIARKLQEGGLVYKDN
jgi:hypothetical protein